MLLHKQKSLYHLSDDEKSDLMDMILVAINEVTKFNPNESDGSRYDYGVDFSNMPPINPYVVSNVLQDLGYEEGDVDTFIPLGGILLKMMKRIFNIINYEEKELESKEKEE